MTNITKLIDWFLSYFGFTHYMFVLWSKLYIISNEWNKLENTRTVMKCFSAAHFDQNCNADYNKWPFELYGPYHEIIS